MELDAERKGLIFSKGRLEALTVDKTVPPLIGIRAGRRIVVTTLTYSVAILFSFIHLPAIWVLLLLVLIPEFIPDRYFGKLQEPSELGS